MLIPTPALDQLTAVYANKQIIVDFLEWLRAEHVALSFMYAQSEQLRSLAGKQPKDIMEAYLNVVTTQATAERRTLLSSKG